MAAESASIRAGRASRDRLLAMLFVATLLHGLLILGITFNTPLAGGRGAPGLRVLLVSDRLPPGEHNATATYLAQRTELGAGNTRRAVLRPSVPTLQPAPPPGHRSAPAFAAPPGRPARGGAEQVLSTTGWSTRVTYRISSSPGTLAAVRAPGGGGAPGARASRRPARLQGPERQLWVSPDTRSSVVAPYLVAWRRKVERIGTLNFPAAARQAGTYAAPIIEVAVASDGRLVNAQIRRSSGDPALDHAALAILRMASPFAPFPPKLARRYRVLRFTYEWQFQGGRVRGSVSAP
jgi:protein TonB